MHREFVPPGESVAGRIAEGERCSSAKAVLQWQGQPRDFGNMIMHGATHRLLCSNSSPVITQPPFSLSLVASDFWLFLTMIMGHKGNLFATVDSHLRRHLNSERFQNNPCVGVSSSGRIVKNAVY
jgi:hypothetical protein